jgi:hypothetical protein
VLNEVDKEFTMNYYSYWEHCVSKIENGNIDEAVTYATETAKQLNISEALIEKIFSVNLKSYEKKIDENMNQCIDRAKNENADALCLYYSLDNGWNSTMYICKGYTKENSNWIGASRSWIDIGKARGFSGIYKKEAESAFFCDEISSGICILLMLRTTIAFYNVVSNYKNCDLKFCITCTESDFVRVG